MVAGRLLEWLVRDTVQEANRDVSRVKRNAVNVVTHPIRTLFNIVFMTLLFGVLYTIVYDGAAVATVDAAEGNSLAMALAILPPLPILALIGAAMVVLVPLTMILQGFKKDWEH
ncbi:hypothetical protein ACFQJ5_13120 [Halomicroarcula sp. GCM10025324]|uniref:hypothetical protein n=1 Tax=Haloarcula TaxID=2237 RepID=UPI0023E8D261|nr:hypothetical protein [Halomicroarcula sp. ZS-22-S1]